MRPAAGGVAPRVLYLSDVAAPRVNGVSTSIEVFRRELARLGIAAPLLAPDYPGTSPQEGITRLRGRPVPFDPEDRWVTPRRYVEAAARMDFDLVHVQTPFAAHAAGHRIARRRGVPIVETWHTDFEHYFEHYLPLVPTLIARAVARRLARRVGRQVDRLVVPSVPVAERLTACGVTTPQVVIPTGLTPGELGAGSRARFRAQYGIDPDRPVVVHVGRLAPEKNLEFLLDALALARREVTELLVVVAGEGPARAALQRQAAALGFGDDLLWLGYLDRQRELADVYAAGDLFAFASLTETQGLVLLEAMSLGVPVVALAAQGTAELLAARRGALVPEARVEAFAAAVVRLLGDAGLRAQLSGEARETARRWSAAGSAEVLAALYAELLDRC